MIDKDTPSGAYTKVGGLKIIRVAWRSHVLPLSGELAGWFRNGACFLGRV